MILWKVETLETEYVSLILYLSKLENLKNCLNNLLSSFKNGNQFKKNEVHDKLIGQKARNHIKRKCMDWKIQLASHGVLNYNLTIKIIVGVVLI